MVIALFGPTCVGKSTVAAALGLELGIAVRHCGEAVKAYARMHRTEVPNLKLTDHRIIDQETVRMAERSIEGLVVEGTFLDIVLSSASLKVRFVRLSCSDPERLRRFIERSHATEEAFRAKDVADERLRQDLYTGCPRANAIVEMDTTGLSGIEAAERLCHAGRNWT
jgi:cytidylate kinase